MQKSLDRLQYLDITKGLAVLFMFTQHCMLVHEYAAGESENLLSLIFVLLGTAPAAPVFMLIMGIFLMRSKATLKQNLVRGAKLLLLGYLLNLLRFTIPVWIASASGQTLSPDESPLQLLLTVDIFQLAGLATIFGALIKKYINRKVYPLLVLATLLVSPLLWGLFDGNSLTMLFWGSGHNVHFPFFPWFVYPLAGMYLSLHLLDPAQVKTGTRTFALTGVFFIITGLVLLFLGAPIGDYHRSGLALHLIILGFIFLWLLLYLRISEKREETGRLVSTLTFWSRNVTAMYFIQWVLFGWSVLLFGANSQNAYVAALIGLAVLLITHYMVKLPSVQKVFRVVR